MDSEDRLALVSQCPTISSSLALAHVAAAARVSAVQSFATLRGPGAIHKPG
jgi:hypothetical protein